MENKQIEDIGCFGFLILFILVIIAYITGCGFILLWEAIFK